MSHQIHLWPEEPVEINGALETGVMVERPGRGPFRLWYRVPSPYRAALTQTCDPYVLATVFTAMHEATDLVVHGEVSPSLLQNLEEYQAAWACWRPERYTKIAIVADVERDHPPANGGGKALVAFSGGVDSSFTVFRHRTGRCGRLQRNIGAGVMVHGFDIPLEQREVFDAARRKSQAILSSLGLDLIPVATNLRQIPQDWEDVFAAATASCLMLLQNGYDTGLIGSSEPYHSLVLPWGSNPVTDWMLSTPAFRIVHDGAAFSRIDKIRELAFWPEALKYLRVCWRGQQKDRNCGRCEKCIRTILDMRVVGLSLPECFEQDVSDSQILNLKKLNGPQRAEFNQILVAARAASINESWVRAVEICLYRNKLAASGQRSFWQRVQRTTAYKKTLPVRRQLRRLPGAAAIGERLQRHLW